MCQNAFMSFYRAGALCASIVLFAATSYRGTMTPFSIQRQGIVPFHLTSGSDGYLLVASMGYIVRMTTAGRFVGAVATPHAADVADAIVAGRDGNIWFAEDANGVARIGRITPTGKLTEYALPPDSSPIALAAGPDGIAFVGHSTPRLGLVSYMGKVSAIDFKTDIDIKSVAYDSSGSLWYAGCERCRAVSDTLKAIRFGTIWSRAGAMVRRACRLRAAAWQWFSAGATSATSDVSGEMRSVRAVVYDPHAMTAAPDGNLWFVNHGPTLSRVLHRRARFQGFRRRLEIHRETLRSDPTAIFGFAARRRLFGLLRAIVRAHRLQKGQPTSATRAFSLLHRLRNSRGVIVVDVKPFSIRA